MPDRQSAPGTGPGGRRRLAVVTVGLVMFLATVASNAPSPLYVIYQQKFHFSALTVTEVFATYAAAVMLSLLTVGHLSDLIGRRRLLAPGLVLLGASTVLFATATGTGSLFAARAVQGIAAGGLTGAATAALVELEPNHDRHRASYINTIVFMTGAATGPLLFGIGAQYFPAPLVSPFLILGALLAVALVGVGLMPEPLAVRPDRRWELRRPSVPRPIRPTFAVSVMALAVSWGIGGLYGALSGTIDRDLLHVTNHALAGLLLFVLSAVGGLSQLTFRRWPPARTVIAGTTAAAIGMTLVYVGLDAANPPLFFVGTLLSGAGSGVAFMGSLALVNQVAPPVRRAEVVSAWNLAGYAAFALPVIGIGLLSQAIGLMDATGLFLGIWVVLSVATVIAAALSPPHPLSALSADQLVELGLDPAIPARGPA